MDLAVLTTLEYHKIRQMLAERTGSVMGRELALALVPTNDAAEVEERLQETQEARDILVSFPNVPLGGMRDIRETLRRCEIGAVLEPLELLAIISVLYASRRLKTFFTSTPVAAPKLRRYADSITLLRNIENAIDNLVNEHGNIRDEASVELARLRREIKIAQSRVKDKIDSILHSSEYQKYFQEALVTIRGDRYVIPIKQEYRHQFPGIVHDQSASGATLFIEPMAVVNLNNDIKQLMAAEKNEIERLLAAISGQIRRVIEPLRANINAMAQLDFAFAKAKLSFDMDADMPVINRQGYVEIKRARHPLISRDVVVPIDIVLGKTFNTLLITGPNTGGKTVSLKTTGLFALMTQAGLFLPAAAAEMPVFNNVYADIGDEQSIEQSLSTFSAHMTNLVKILSRVTSADLVLIDEIGAGTDPGEGAALAMAILEYLHEKGVRTLATTHYSELKTFAYTRHGIENASVEFDINSLKPTYRLLIGIPGSSNAFAISRRLGLSEALIKRAQSFLDKDHAEFEKLLAALEEQKLKFTRNNDEIARVRQELVELQRKLREEEQILADKKQTILAKAQDEAAAIIRQARRQAEEVIAALKEQFAIMNEKESQKVIENARKKLRDNMAALNNLTADEFADYDVTAEIIPGTPVYLSNLRQKGTVLSISGNEATVQVGILKINVPLSSLRVIAEKPAAASKQVKSSSSGLAKAQQISREADVRGLTVTEAVEILEKFLDDAVLAGLSEVLIIHGKGTGALRKGIRAFLKQHPHVQEIRIGEISEGGDGVTVVRLR